MSFDVQRRGRLLAGASATLAAGWFMHPGILRSRGGSNALFDVLALLLGCGLVLFGFAVLRRKRLLENIPTSRIRSVAMGFAELLGTAKNRTPLVAPYSGIPCVYYRYQIEEERRGQRGRHWATIDRGESNAPFYLQDDTAALLVDPEGAETILERSFRTVERKEGFFGGRQRFSEWWIVPGQKVFVAGTVRRTRDAVLERRAVMGDRVRELKHDPEKMKAVDTDHDGRISTEEWGNAVRAVQDEVVREQAAEPREIPEETIAIGKGSEETTFVIAARGEKTLLIRLRLQAAGSLLGGAAAIVVFAVSLLSRTGLISAGWIFRW